MQVEVLRHERPRVPDVHPQKRANEKEGDGGHGVGEVEEILGRERKVAAEILEGRVQLHRVHVALQLSSAPVGLAERTERRPRGLLELDQLEGSARAVGGGDVEELGEAVRVDEAPVAPRRPPANLPRVEEDDVLRRVEEGQVVGAAGARDAGTCKSELTRVRGE